MSNDRMTTAAAILERFAERTGLVSDRTAQRYLWTDAFAVCTWLGIARTTHEPRYVDLALRLIRAVHTTLGHHRPDDTRRGWLSGLGDTKARQHPTLGGLRIGKPLPEANPYDLIDTEGELNRDGQYFHYLTKWMHALDQATRATGDWRFNIWARELAVRAFDSFSYVENDTGLRRLYWKMSIDLTRAAVPSPGQHDPLDGYVTYMQLQATTTFAAADTRLPDVGDHANSLLAAIDVSHLHTADPLGLGGLLFDAARIEQLTEGGAFRDESLAAFVLATAASGLANYKRNGRPRQPPELRLPFRELGLAVGLHGLELVAGTAASRRLQAMTRMLERDAPLAAEIEEFWLRPSNREAAAWTAHRDINDVTLAAALAPAGLIELLPPPPSELHGRRSTSGRPRELQPGSSR
jgi:hypothetical protein